MLPIEDMAQLTLQARSATAAIAAVIQEHHMLFSEISRTVQQIPRGSIDLARNMDGVSKVIMETASSADQALLTSDRLLSEADRLSRAVDAFLVKVRAA